MLTIEKRSSVGPTRIQTLHKIPWEVYMEYKNIKHECYLCNAPFPTGDSRLTPLCCRCSQGNILGYII
jgi:hypothetical protein